jgi:hypothetical protein
MNPQFKFRVSFDVYLDEDEFPEWIMPSVEDQLNPTEVVENFIITRE